MKKLLLIGLAGQKFSGKDTAADGVAGCLRTSFAEPFKDMLQAGLGLTREQLYGSKKETPIDWLGNGKDVTPRYLMQSIGTEWGRLMVDPEIWVKLTKRYIQQWQGDCINGHDLPQILLVTDVRHPAEAQMLREMGGVVVHVKRHHPMPSWKDFLRRLKAWLTQHSSEIPLAVEPEDEVIFNLGTIPELQEALRSIIRKHKEKV